MYIKLLKCKKKQNRIDVLSASSTSPDNQIDIGSNPPVKIVSFL